MAKSQATIISEIESYVADNTNLFSRAFMSTKVIYSSWYCGVTSDPRSNHSRHGNPECHCFWRANSENVARAIEVAFLSAGMKGDVGGGTGKNDVVYVYVYKITEETDDDYYTMF